jgi:hypothetical protein
LWPTPPVITEVVAPAFREIIAAETITETEE